MRSQLPASHHCAGGDGHETFLRDTKLMGAWFKNNTIFVCAGSSMSGAPLAVIVNGGRFEEITCPSSTDFLSDVGVSGRCAITQEEFAEWDPDANAVIVCAGWAGMAAAVSWRFQVCRMCSARACADVSGWNVSRTRWRSREGGGGLDEVNTSAPFVVLLHSL